MMINVSPWKNTQKTVAGLTEDYLHQLRDSVKAYSSLPSEIALKASEDIRLFNSTWENEYADSTEFTWDEVQDQLYDTIRSMRLVIINSDSNDSLEYEINTEHVIAVGGYRLSRGLTLEGLVVSYYSRNAMAYDALMQMARWFGYRPRYEDLCRIWMSEKSAGWYKFVADSTSDLIDELRNMRQVNRSPRDYGLKIRQSPDSLIVTARNKMGTGTTLTAPVNLNNGFVETIAFDREKRVVDDNLADLKSFLEKIDDHRDSDFHGFLYRGVPYEIVVEYISNYINEDAHSPKSQIKPLLNYIDDRTNDGELLTWNVYIATGKGHEKTIATNVTCQFEIRSPGQDTSKDFLIIGEKQRLSSRGIEGIDLSDEQKRAAESEYREYHPNNSNVSDKSYRKHRAFPLLVIHPVQVKYSSQQMKKKKAHGIDSPEAGNWKSWDYSEDVYGWSVSLPHSDKQTAPVQYVFNQVAIENLRENSEEGTDDDIEDDS
jgi:hypothetical protein